MGAGELSEWMAYDAIEPIGPERGDLQAAVVAATIANIHRKKGKKPFKLSDFTLKFDGPTEQTPEQMLRLVEVINEALGGKDKRGERGHSRDA